MQFGGTGDRGTMKLLDLNSVKWQCPNRENNPALHQESEDLFTLFPLHFTDNFPPSENGNEGVKK